MKGALIYTGMFLLALAIGAAFIEIRDGFKTPVEHKTQVEDEWCLITILDGSGGYFGSNTAGEYEYQVIATTKGYEVYQRCGKI